MSLFGNGIYANSHLTEHCGDIYLSSVGDPSEAECQHYKAKTLTAPIQSASGHCMFYWKCWIERPVANPNIS